MDSFRTERYHCAPVEPLFPMTRTAGFQLAAYARLCRVSSAQLRSLSFFSSPVELTV